MIKNHKELTDSIRESVSQSVMIGPGSSSMNTSLDVRNKTTQDVRQNISVSGQSKSSILSWMKKADNRKEINQIDLNRANTHRIIDIAQELGSSFSFTRACNFKYKLGKNGVKELKKKHVEIKIENYKSMKSGESQSVRIGYVNLDISEYYNKPI